MFAGYRQCMNRVLVREIKEGLCQLPEAFIASTTQVPGLTAMLPDGNTIELQVSRPLPLRQQYPAADRSAGLCQTAESAVRCAGADDHRP